MRTIAIFVATTGGPAEIERLTPEFAPQSMVCLRRGSDILPISDDYDDFVKRGSGVIEREFGPFDTASFRMDVSESIGTGKSWQLGVFAAHAVAASEDAELAVKESTPDRVVWLTGEVDYDLGVGPVGHVAEKVAASTDFFEKWRDVGVPILVIVPKGKNLVDMTGSVLPEDVEVVAISNATEILARLELNDLPAPVISPVSPEQAKVSPSKKGNKLGRVGAILGAIVILVLAGWTIGPDRLAGMMDSLKALTIQKTAEKSPVESPGSSPGKLPTPPKIPAKTAKKVISGVANSAGPSLRVFERRPPNNATCAKVHFGRVEAETRAVKISAAKDFATSNQKNLCGLKFVFNLGLKPHYISAGLEVETGAFVRGNSKPRVFSGIQKTKGEQVWSIDVPRHLGEPLQYSLLVIVGKQATAAEMSWYLKQNDGKQAAQTLAKKGFLVLTWRHKITP